MNPPQLQEPKACVSKLILWNDGRKFMKLLDSSQFEYRNLMEYSPKETIEMESTGCFRYCVCEKTICENPCEKPEISGWGMKKLNLEIFSYLCIIEQ